MEALTVEKLAEIYRLRHDGLVRSAIVLTGDIDTARDAVQEGFARALQARKRFREGTPEGWVWRIVERTALEQRRRVRRQRGQASLTDDRAVTAVAAFDPTLAEALRSLPERQRLMVFLRYYADYSQIQVAESCGVSEGTVAAALSRARSTLRETIETKAVSP